MSSHKHGKRGRDQLTFVSESVASLRRDNEAMKQRLRSLEGAKEQERLLNNERMQRLKKETEEHASVDQIFQVSY